MDNKELALGIILPLIIAAICIGVGFMMIHNHTQKMKECNRTCGESYEAVIQDGECECMEPGEAPPYL